ncbi:hypothetical protein KDA00_05550 [Candidatus Saccharibacteria bacterium]|nr:hypothetical protein [Candidatus Saccharibacteria bacterium]
MSLLSVEHSSTLEQRFESLGDLVVIRPGIDMLSAPDVEGTDPKTEFIGAYLGVCADNIIPGIDEAFDFVGEGERPSDEWLLVLGGEATATSVKRGQKLFSAAFETAQQPDNQPGSRILKCGRKVTEFFRQKKWSIDSEEEVNFDEETWNIWRAFYLDLRSDENENPITRESYTERVLWAVSESLRRRLN